MRYLVLGHLFDETFLIHLNDTVMELFYFGLEDEDQIACIMERLLLTFDIFNLLILKYKKYSTISKIGHYKYLPA